MLSMILITSMMSVISVILSIAKMLITIDGGLGSGDTTNYLCCCHYIQYDNLDVDYN